MSSSTQEHIIVLGAGISGLQTALSLLTTPSTAHYKITIIAEHTPGNLSPAYTSPWAGGHWRSHATSPALEDVEQRQWDKRTYEFWTNLIHGDPHVKISPNVEGRDVLEKAIKRMRIIGLGEKESRNYWGSVPPPTPPPFFPIVKIELQDIIVSADFEASLFPKTHQNNSSLTILRAAMAKKLHPNMICIGLLDVSHFLRE